MPVSPEEEDISMATTLRALPSFFCTALLAGLLAAPLSPLLSPSLTTPLPLCGLP